MAERNASTQPLSSLISDPVVRSAFERAERDDGAACNALTPIAPVLPPTGELRMHVCKHDVCNDIRRGDLLGLRTTEEFIRDGRYLDAFGDIWLVQSTVNCKLMVKTLAQAERGERAVLVDRADFEETLVAFVYGVMRVIDPHMAYKAA